MELPPLPEAINENFKHGRAGYHEAPGPAYSAHQMRSYAAAAVADAIAEEREAIAKMAEQRGTAYLDGNFYDFADAIRARSAPRTQEG